ncbi:MAG: CotH kinase family protein [Deltaproteobacteria bacterium]|nr:CotH kinase family protein [Deltaproteobacteria bacterium]
MPAAPPLTTRQRPWLAALGVAGLLSGACQRGAPTSPAAAATLPPVAPAPVDEVAPGGADPAAQLWSATAPHRLRLELAPADWAALGADAPSEAERPGLLWWDGGQIPDVHVSLRGREGSFLPIWRKPKLRFDFNDLVDNRLIMGQKALAINNSSADCSLMRDVAGLELFRRAGVATPRSTWGRLAINDVEYGVLPMIEVVDDRFLAARFDEAEGNLYDGKYVYDADGAVVLLDLRPETAALYEQEEGEDVALADIWAVTEAATAHFGQPDWMAATSPLVDWPAVQRFLAAERVAGQVDGYTLNRNNYFVYFDPGDGRLQLIPWDLDNSFRWAADWGMDWEAPIGILAHGCRVDPTCAAGLAAEVDALVRTLEAEDFDGWVAAQAAALVEAQPDDPRDRCSPSRVAAEQEELFARMPLLRADALAAWGTR